MYFISSLRVPGENKSQFEMRQTVESPKIRKRLQHLSEFLKKFPEFEVDPEAVYQEMVEKIAD